MTWIDSVCVRLISGLARRETRLQDGSLKHTSTLMHRREESGVLLRLWFN